MVRHRKGEAPRISQYPHTDDKGGDMILSEHLQLSEVIRSETAKRKGINNMPTAEHIANLKTLAEKIFEPIRKNFRCPIIISSGYRSKKLNSFIGSKTSQHCTGEAIDIDMDATSYGVSNADIFNYIKDHLSFDQLIWEFGTSDNPAWVHVSYDSSGTQRRQALKASTINGKTIYSNFI